MSVKCEVKEIVKALKIVSKALAFNSISPEYGYVDLQFGPNKAALSTYNGLMAIRAELPVSGSEKGDVVLDGGKFSKYFLSFEAETSATVEIKVSPKTVLFAVSDEGKLSVTRPIMNSAFHKIKIPGQKLLTLDSGFFAMCNLLMSAAGSDESRPVTINTRMDFGNGVAWITNGPVLGESRFLFKGAPAMSLVLPNQFLSTVKSVFDVNGVAFDVYTSKSALTVVSQDRMVALEHALPVFTYPDFKPMLASYRNGLSYIEVSRKEFIARFNKIGAMLDADRKFKLAYKGGSNLELSYGMTDASTVTEKLPCSGSTSGEVLFNYDYIKDFFDAASKCAGDLLRFGFTSAPTTGGPPVNGVVFDIGEPMLYVALPWLPPPTVK